MGINKGTLAKEVNGTIEYIYISKNISRYGRIYYRS